MALIPSSARKVTSICWALLTSLLIVNNQLAAIAYDPSADNSPALRSIAPESVPNKFQSSVEALAITNDKYILGPGDELTIVDQSLSLPITQTQETSPQNLPVSQILPILPDGTINVFQIGNIKAAGLTIGQLNRLINYAAAKYMKFPMLTVYVSKPRPITVYVFGAVETPGLIGSSVDGQPPGENTTNVSAQSISGGETKPLASELHNVTVSTAIKHAGGLKESADTKHVLVTRRSSNKVQEVNLWKLMVEHTVENDLTLEPGDVVYVPPVQNAAPQNNFVGMVPNRQVGIWGEVKTPGLIDLRPGTSLLAALAKVGGPSQYARDKIVLSRVNVDGTVNKRIFSMKKSLSGQELLGRAEVNPGDLIIVPPSYFKKSIEKIAVGLGTFAGLFTIMIVGHYIPTQIRTKYQGSVATFSPFPTSASTTVVP